MAGRCRIECRRNIVPPDFPHDRTPSAAPTGAKALLQRGSDVAGNAIGIFVLHAGVAGVAYPSLISRVFAKVALSSIVAQFGTVQIAANVSSSV